MLVFTSTLSKIEYKVEPDPSLQLCWISAVGRTEFTTFVQTLDLLFGERLLVNHASYVSRLSEVFHEGIITWLASVMIENCLQCSGERRNRSMAARMDFIEDVS